VLRGLPCAHRMFSDVRAAYAPVLDRIGKGTVRAQYVFGRARCTRARCSIESERVLCAHSMFSEVRAARAPGAEANRKGYCARTVCFRKCALHARPVLKRIGKGTVRAQDVFGSARCTRAGARLESERVLCAHRMFSDVRAARAPWVRGASKNTRMSGNSARGRPTEGDAADLAFGFGGRLVAARVRCAPRLSATRGGP